MKNKFGKMNTNVDVKAEPLDEQGDSAHHEKQLFSSSNQTLSISNKSRVPEDATQQVDKIKIELDDFVNIIETRSMPTTQSQASNDQNNNRSSGNHRHFDGNKSGTDFCVKKEEEDDQENSIENVRGMLIENFGENDDYNSRSAKKLRLDDDQQEDYNNDSDDNVELSDDFDESDDSSPRQTKASRGEKTKQTRQKLIIIVSLKCPQCSQMLKNTKALNAHLKSAHSIEQYRCLYKDCNRSFDKLINLTLHLRATHPTQANVLWPCGHCCGYFKNNVSLLSHYMKQHEEGIFQCAHPDCQFVAQLKQTVYNHFATNHKVLSCQYPGCTKSYNLALNLKSHQLTHRNVKPFRCKWPECQYDSVVKYQVLYHIRRHLKKVVKSTQKPSTKMSFNPFHYLEIVNELL